jgi:dihydrofolate reductase
MRKIVMFNLVTADGYFAGAYGSLDWFVADEEFDRVAAELIQRFDTILFGRVTYELFKSYWPNALTDPATSPEDRVIAQKIHDMTKIVFSTSAIDTDWNKTRLLSSVTVEEIERLKADDGGDIVIYGSSIIVQQLTDLGLVDEYQFLVNPLILGAGKPLFKGAGQLKLKLIDTRVFDSGNVFLHYQASKPS